VVKRLDREGSLTIGAPPLDEVSIEGAMNRLGTVVASMRRLGFDVTVDVVIRVGNPQRPDDVRATPTGFDP